MRARIAIALLVDTVAHEAGAERQVAETAARLDASRFDVHLCCLEPSPRLDALASRCRTAVFPMARVNSLSGLRQVWQLRRYLSRHGIVLVHSFANKTAIAGVLAAWKPRGPVIVTSRLNTGYWYTPRLVRLFRLLNRFTTRVVANSEGARKIAMAAESLPLEKVDVLYQGVDMEVYRRGDPAAAAALGIPAASRVVGIVANLREVKDLPLFLRAAQRVAREVPDAAFLLVGQGPLRTALGALASELGIASRVFFTDGRGAVPDYLARMSIGCLSSKSEGFSNAILEYMAAGLPVVATAVGGNAEAVAHGETGYIVAERTPEAFAAPLVTLLRDEPLRREMGRRGLERCRSRFEIAATIRALEDYYGRLAAPGKARP